MKHILYGLLLMAPVSATAGPYYALNQHASSATLKLGGNVTAWDIVHSTRPIIDIRAYGAIPNDGISDSTPTQRALTDLQATGGTLLIPGGTFYFDQFRLVYASTHPIAIQCRGWESLLLFNPANDTPASPPSHFGQINIHGISNIEHVPQVVVRDCQFDFGKSSASAYSTNHQGLTIHGSDNVYIENNWFHGAAGEMLSLGNFSVTGGLNIPGERAFVSNNRFSNCAQSAANPSMDDTLFVDNYLEDCTIEATGRNQTYVNNTFERTKNGAITVSGGEDFIISNNRMTDCDIGAAARGALYGCIAMVGQGGNSGMYNGVISGNVITSTVRPQSQFTSGIYTTLGTNTQPSQNINISNNVIDNMYRGMYLTSITSSVITGNSINNQTASCIEIPKILPTVAQGSFTVVGNFFNKCGIVNGVDLNGILSTQTIKVGPNWNPTDNTYTFSSTSMTYTGQLGIGTNVTSKDITIGNIGGSATKTIRINSGNSWDIESSPTGYFHIKNFDTSVNLINGDNAGRVGIGTLTPTSKLHISTGTIKIDGTGAPTVGFSVCMSTGGFMGHCTSAVSAVGGCTCVTP